jgi:hypothetical protein
MPLPSPTHAPPCRPFLASFSRRAATAVLTRRHGPDVGAFTFTHTPEWNAALAHLCTLARMRALTGEVKARPLASLFFPCAEPRRDVAPLLAALPWPWPWRFASCTQPQGRGAPSLWPFSARLTTGFCPQLHASVPGRESPVRRRLWHHPEPNLGQEDPKPTGNGPSPHSCTHSASPVACMFGPEEERTPALSPVIVFIALSRSAPPRRFAAEFGPRFESHTPLHSCAPKRTRVHACSHRHGRPSRTAAFRCCAQHTSQASPFYWSQ